MIAGIGGIKGTQVQVTPVARASVAGWRCLAAALSVALVGCALRPDPNRQFAVSLNGSESTAHLGNPVGYVQEMEAGFSSQKRYTIVFPLKVRSPVPRPGLEITFDPEKIAPGEEIPFTDEYGEPAEVDYSPLWGHRYNQGIMLAFSSRRRGGGTIRFDELDPALGGRVRGKLIEATLNGYDEHADRPEVEEPTPAKKLTIRNVPFDVNLQSSPF